MGTKAAQPRMMPTQQLDLLRGLYDRGKKPWMTAMEADTASGYVYQSTNNVRRALGRLATPIDRRDQLVKHKPRSTKPDQFRITGAGVRLARSFGVIE